MNTPSEPNAGLATQAEIEAIEEEVKDMKVKEMFFWGQKNPDKHRKLLASWEKPETINANTKNPSSHARTPPQTSAILRALQKDWNNTYFPHSLVALRSLVRHYQLLNAEQYYAKTLVFVQSSGMGKSRLADAFGQLCPMITFILRDPETSGFPPPDEEIRSFLRTKLPANIPGPTSEQGISRGTSGDFLKKRADVAWNHTLVTALLQASFETFNTWVESKPFTTMTLEELARDRHAEMAPHAPAGAAQDAKSQRSKIRVEFCGSVAKRAQAIAKELISSPAWVGKFDDDGPSKVHDELTMAHSEQCPNPLNGLLNAADNLMKNLQQCQEARNPDSLLVIVFDEASSLMRMQPLDEPHPGLYVALNRVISCLKKFRMWSFFLSTESLIGHLVPPKNAVRTGDYLRDSSARISFQADPELKRFTPFVALQLDVEDRRRMQDPMLRKEELLKPLKTFATPEHMALFGRPLWYAYTSRGNDMMKLAKLKLIGGQQRAQYISTDPDHVFAALSFRLSLDVCLQNPSTVSLTRTAVNSFMRVVISMDHETGMMDTVTPSEPVLARAAMEHLCDRNWSRSITTLCRELLEKGLIEKGRKGELYARLVLILAHDWVRWSQSLRYRPNAVPAFAPTFTVSDFLTALYAEDHHDSIRKIPERIHEARMNFTHFVPAHKPLTAKVIPNLCHDLLRRSAAMQLSWEQETYDLLIPVYYGTEDEKFDPSNCGVILVQVKNKTDATTPRAIFEEDFVNVSPETRNPANLKARSSERDPKKFVFNQMANPILFLLFDLGVVRSNRAYAPLVQVMHSKSGKQPDLWAIHSRGYDDTIFGCLQRMNVTDSHEQFFASVHIGDTLADRLSLRNRTFYELEREFRYEGFEEEGEASAGGSETRVQAEDVGEAGARDFAQGHLPFRRRSDPTQEEG